MSISTTTTSYTDDPVTISQFNVVIASVGYEFHRERGDFLIWKLVGKINEPHRDRAWPAQLTRRKPYCTTPDMREKVYTRNDLADALMEVTGDGPVDAVVRIIAILDKSEDKN